MEIKLQKTPMPTKEELEFFETELGLIVKNYRLEDSMRALDRLFEMMLEMAGKGEIGETPEDIMRAWDTMLQKHPDINSHLNKLASVLYDEFIKEIKQRKRPN